MTVSNNLLDFKVLPPAPGLPRGESHREAGRNGRGKLECGGAWAGAALTVRGQLSGGYGTAHLGPRRTPASLHSAPKTWGSAAPHWSAASRLPSLLPPEGRVFPHPSPVGSQGSPDTQPSSDSDHTCCEQLPATPASSPLQGPQGTRLSPETHLLVTAVHGQDLSQGKAAGFPPTPTFTQHPGSTIPAPDSQPGWPSSPDGSHQSRPPLHVGTDLARPGLNTCLLDKPSQGPCCPHRRHRSCEELRASRHALSPGSGRQELPRS